MVILFSRMTNSRTNAVRVKYLKRKFKFIKVGLVWTFRVKKKTNRETLKSGNVKNYQKLDFKLFKTGQITLTLIFEIYIGTRTHIFRIIGQIFKYVWASVCLQFILPCIKTWFQGKYIFSQFSFHSEFYCTNFKVNASVAGRFRNFCFSFESNSLINQ